MAEKKGTTKKETADLPHDAAPGLGYGAGALATRDASAEVDERDLSPGQRRRAGQAGEPRREE